MTNKQHYRACTFGRFNLFHNGHLLLIKRMQALADYVTIGLSTGPKNLPFELRKEVIDLALLGQAIPYSVVEAAHPFDLFDQVKGKRNDDVIAIFGADQSRLGLCAEKHYGWASGVVERITSSTALRVAIDEEDWDLVAHLTCPGTATHLVNLRKLELTN